MFKVKNNNATDFQAGYDGKQYLFPAGKTVVAPDDAVNHIFGLLQKNKRDIILRHGWAKPHEPMQVGIAVLKNFSFDKLDPKFDEPPALVHGQRPAPLVSDDEDAEGDEPKASSSARAPSALERAAAAKRTPGKWRVCRQPSGLSPRRRSVRGDAAPPVNC